jgi:nucleoside-diphosphate-sugar epimerase
MAKKMRVLVTGNEGYIGSVMAPWLQSRGYEVMGIDNGYFADCRLVPELGSIATVKKDIRELAPSDLRGFDAVVHLAALSNDPIGNLNERWTKEINGDATVTLARLAKSAGVKRFVFSSSCIMYGMADSATVDENSALAPQTQYARSKVDAEMALRELASDDFSPTYCRNGTVYGLSPRMRFDTVLNNFMGGGFTTKRITIHSDGTPWRPVVHVRDVARAFERVLEAPREAVHNEAFNIGADELNWQIGALAEAAASVIPGCEVVRLANAGADQRTYKAKFAKLADRFPDFRFEWSVPNGAEELYLAFQRSQLTAELFTDKRFTRLKWLEHLLAEGALDRSLRWTHDERAGSIIETPALASV